MMGEKKDGERERDMRKRKFSKMLIIEPRPWGYGWSLYNFLTFLYLKIFIRKRKKFRLPYAKAS